MVAIARSRARRRTDEAGTHFLPVTSACEILRIASDWRACGKSVAVATVVETWGSTPRPVGSHLIVDDAGLFVGSVSGGCVEGDVIAEATDLLQFGAPRLLTFDVSDERAWRSGLTCGGRIKVHVQRLDDNLASCFATVIAAQAAGRPVALVTDLKSGSARAVTVDDIPGDPMADLIGERLRAGKSDIIEQSGHGLMVTVFVPGTRLIVVGAVHIAQALASMAQLIDLDMTIIDPRSAFAASERFAGSQLMPMWPSDAIAKIGLDRTDAIVLLSHDPKIDDQALIEALKADCFYIGALGSRRTHAKRLERMRGAGLQEDALARIHAPVGLDIGAESPAEIAVAIVAEIIAARRRKPLRTAAAEAA